MSFIGDIFGGGDKGSPSQVVDVTPEQFEKLRGPLANVLKGLFSGGVAGAPKPGGPTTAPVSQQEQSFLDLIGQQAGTSPTTASAQDLIGQTLQGKFLTPDANPFLQSTIEAAIRPVREQFERQTLPGLRSQFTGAGQLIQEEGSSPFVKALGQSQSDFLNTIADTSSRIAFGNFQAERDRQQGAVGQALQIDAAQLDEAVKGLQASALPRIIEQFGIDRGIEIFNQQVSVLLEALRIASAVSSPQTTVLPGSSGSDVGGLLGGLGSLGFGIGALL